MRRKGALGRQFFAFFRPGVGAALTGMWLLLILVLVVAQLLLDVPQERLVALGLPLFALAAALQGSVGAAILVSPRARALLARSPQQVAANRSLIGALVALHYLAAAIVAVVVVAG